ncbi:glycoside hydrolase family 127 protein [Stakelama saccharophila]|uniref:Glycoside hydrolase family 127 protein n=1 Tax=Stakelama saccharophila TaxID=3075605 RepID=A0ABZ0B7K2_9SPHN|nr:glycoside hydrolase family 127 protein [Stakelama sp. W311]WNO53407.1 glycoside hydrolase family 127 protein [Stakelama sp. W311]
MIVTTRRMLLIGAAASAMLARSGAALAVPPVSRLPGRAKPLPLSAVRLLPSDYATAVEVNRGYLMRLVPDRLLHNFRLYAGLKPKGEVYGGWESDTIAGHTLGHYLSALALMHAQTGDAEACERANYIVDELALAQDKRGTGYVGALQRKRKDGTVVDGEEIFTEIIKGDIRSGGFDLNGAWSPLYTVHKLFAGLLDVQALCGNDKAMKVAIALGGYFERVFAALDEDQMQEVLACEYGGLNESFAEMYARTRDKRWLRIAERIYDHKVLDPLVAREDKLANFHANTQVPKLIGLARLHELTGKEFQRVAPRYFWETVTRHHSYVIGGNADREYFSAPDTIAEHITEQTCEHCNTYNMLKLTEHLFGWNPDGALFDYYERAHLNHVMAAQNPRTAGFSYMTPLMTGSAREYSQPGEDAFWCCVGTGMESHAKHGEAIFWEGDGMLFVNLYIPAEASWKARGAELTLDTNYPFEPETRLTFDRLAKPGRFPVALRIPGWAGSAATVAVNGKPFAVTPDRGYAVVERQWKQGDTVAIVTPLDLRIEATPGDAKTIAVMRGPMVLAGDLGTKESDFEGTDPAMVGTDLLAGFAPLAADRGIYSAKGVIRPGDLKFVPFYSQYDRRSAVYFKRFTEPEWKQEEAAFLAAQARAKDIAARSVDVMHLGEMQPERDHELTSEISYPVTYRGRNGRDARSGGFFEFDMKVQPGPLILQATYWGGERSRDFDILVDDVKVATQHLEEDEPGEFVDVEYRLPEALTEGKDRVRVKFIPHAKSSAGPVFGVRIFTAKPAVTT